MASGHRTQNPEIDLTEKVEPKQKSMKHVILSTALLCAVVSCFVSCGKSGTTPQPVNPVDTITTPPTAIKYSYTYDSSFKSTGSLTTMGAVQPDGKIIIANTTQIARLNQDGTLDNGFATGNAAGGEFHSLALQKDGKILVGGSFTSFNGQGKAYYLRLNANGSVDNGFTVLPLTSVSAQPKIDIKSIAVQSDNKILLGGNFYYIVSDVNGLTSGPKQIVRLNENGAYDPTFKHNVTAASVNCLRVLADGKMLVTGQSVSVEFYPTPATYDIRNNVVKLKTDGSVDASFKWLTTTFAMRSPYTYLKAYGQTIAVQDDGKILLGGRFETTSTITADDYSGMIRLKADGSIDNTFPKRGFTGVVSALCLASDRLVVGSMHDPDKTYTDANIATNQFNKDGTDNTTFKVNNFTNYGDVYLVLEDASKNLLIFGKLYDKITTSVYTYHGVVRLKKL